MLLLSRNRILHYFDHMRKRFFVLLLTKWRVEYVGGWVARHGWGGWAVVGGWEQGGVKGWFRSTQSPADSFRNAASWSRGDCVDLMACGP